MKKRFKVKTWAGIAHKYKYDRVSFFIRLSIYATLSLMYIYLCCLWFLCND